MILDTTGNEISKDASTTKIRLSRVYKKTGQTMQDFMGELKNLTPEDHEDFARWFTEAGYPTTVVHAA